MFKKIALIVVLAQFAAAPVFAQATRAEVKAAAASANKAGTVTKAEGTTEPEGKSTKARAEVKKDAAMASKAGNVTKAEGTTEPTGKSVKARADVKKDAAAANKSGAQIGGENTK